MTISMSQRRINKRYIIPKGQSKMDNPEKLATQGTQYEKKTQHNTCRTSPHASKHKQCK